ncbi:MAG: vWA domain-containing protein [Polyangiaceae bacterium]
MTLRDSLFGSLLVAALVGCAPTAPDALTGTGGGNSSGKGSGTGGSDTSTVAGQNGSTGAGFSDATATSGSTMACAQASIEAQVAPLAMYIMFDRSGSMGDNNKWTNASQALKKFFGNPKTAGLEVALRFFPEGNCDGNQCDVNACATPKVDAAPLSANPMSMDPQEKALVDAVTATTPNGNTPMFAALKGAVKWGTEFEAAHTDHKTVVILITDGEPNGCVTDTDQIANEAMTGAANGIDTFAIGLQGSNEATIDKIAAAGGTDQGFFIGNANTEADLIAALQAIQGKAIACEIAIPEPTTGELDPNKVNVSYTPGGGSETTIGHVTSAQACGSSSAWYYDDPVNPTKIILCPDTCDTVQGDGEAKLNIVLGCDTQPA